MGVAVDPADLQGLVRRPYRYQLSRHLLFGVSDAAAARDRLRRLIPRVTTGAADLSASPEPLVNVGVTWPGLVRLGAFGADQAGAADAFPDRFAHQAAPPPHEWQDRFAGADIDLVVQIHCRSDDALAAASREIRNLAQGALVERRVRDGDEGALSGRAIAGGRMHFGVLDGISEPEIGWTDQDIGWTDQDNGSGAGAGLIDLRHLLLGHATAEVQSHPNVEPWASLVRNGTYAVMQWIYQDSAAFARYVQDAAPLLAPGLPATQAAGLLRAKMLGRWDDGTPLALSPDGPDAATARTAFGYADDPHGLRCPLHAHVRLANRRDQALNPLEAGTFPGPGPHLWRRGLPYGPELQGTVDDGVDRGLIGMFLCADLQRQYFTVRKWLDRADFSPVFDPRRSHLQDLMMADRSFPDADTAAVIPTATGSPALPPMVQFTHTRGTLLMLLPGLAGLARIARDP